MSLQGKSLYVMTPMYGGGLTLNYHNSFIRLVLLCRDLGIPIGWSNTFNESLISRARNRLADNFLKSSENTHAIFIDADIGFEPEDVMSMLEMDKDLLGVPCSKKSIRFDRIQNAIARRVLDWVHVMGNGQPPERMLDLWKKSGRAFDPAELPRIGGDFVFNFLPFEGEKTITVNEPLEMKHVGTGLLMVKREVFLNFKKAYPDRWYESKADPASNPGQVHDFFKCGVNIESREYDSEDFWFVHDCIAMGYKVLLCPWVRTTHMGTNMFIGDMPAALAATGEIF